MVKEDFHDGASERRGLKTEEQRGILDGMRSLERQSGIKSRTHVDASSML